MVTVLKVATCQFPVSADVEQNAGWMIAQMEKAARGGARVAHFPEGALSGYQGWTSRGEIDGVRCGALICYDYRFPELYRQYVTLGVQVMFHSVMRATPQLSGSQRSGQRSATNTRRLTRPRRSRIRGSPCRP